MRAPHVTFWRHSSRRLGVKIPTCTHGIMYSWDYSTLGCRFALWCKPILVPWPVYVTKSYHRVLSSIAHSLMEGQPVGDAAAHPLSPPVLSSLWPPAESPSDHSTPSHFRGPGPGATARLRCRALTVVQPCLPFILPGVYLRCLQMDWWCTQGRF